MHDAAKQSGKWLKTDEKRPSYQGRTFARDTFPWHEALCLQQADSTSFRALTSWIVISLMIAAFAAALAASGAATMTSVVTLAFAGLASLYFGYLECLKLIAHSCNGRRM